LNAFEKVPREKFIPELLKPHAYEDNALPIEGGQTISQPYTIAVMLNLLDLELDVSKVLEVGSGSGYVLALLAEIVGSQEKVYGIEIAKELYKKSLRNLKKAGYSFAKVYNKNGSEGLTEEAPFSRILISAACEKVPDDLLKQLKDKGILVAPIDTYDGQELIKIQRQKDKFIIKQKIPGFVFVRFVGE
jgi:protein-L-isoaspartate(D-aspartate) O-methyltransferase